MIEYGDDDTKVLHRQIDTLTGDLDAARSDLESCRRELANLRRQVSILRKAIASTTEHLQAAEFLAVEVGLEATT